MRKYSRSLGVDVVGGLQQASDVGYVDPQARRVVERSLDFEADHVLHLRLPQGSRELLEHCAYIHAAEDTPSSDQSMSSADRAARALDPAGATRPGPFWIRTLGG